MDIKSKMNAGVASIAKTMKSGVDNCKLDTQIAEQQKKIKVLTREIGNLALVRLEAGDEMSPEIMERFEAIKEAKETIETLRKEKKKYTVVCPSCGTKTSAQMKYCGMCGSVLAEEQIISV